MTAHRATPRQRLQILRQLLRSMDPWMRRGLILCYLVSTAADALLPLALRTLINGAVAHDTPGVIAGVGFLTAAAVISDSAGRAGKDLTVYWRNASGLQVNLRMARLIAKSPTLEHLERPEYGDQVQLLAVST